MPEIENGLVYRQDMLYRYCSNCGSSFYSLWDVPWNDRPSKERWIIQSNQISKKIHSEMDAIKQTPCPVCNASSELSRYCSKAAFADERGTFKKGDRADLKNWGYWIDYTLQKPVLEEERIIGKDNAEAFLKKWDCSVPQGKTSQKEQICTSLENLKEYLSNLIRLEINIYSLTRRLSSLYFERKQISKTVNRDIGTSTKVFRDALAAAEADLNKIRQEGVTVEQPVKPPLPVLKKPNLFNKAKVLAENEAATAQYNAAMEEYARQIEACQAEEKRLTEKAISEASERVRLAEASLEAKQAEMESVDIPSAVLARSADHEIEEAEKCLKDTLKARNELYSYNVVFGKYRNLVAVSTFYEYLMAGRCTALEGVDGAYNIYEAEIRTNMIISQLTVIIQKLEEIKANQYMLYSELRIANQNLLQISEKMDSAIEALDRIGDNAEQIAYNTEATAFYAKKNAELTDALGFMVAFK